MYLDFFGFSEAPFSLSPDPRFIYFSKPHREVFALLLYGIERRYGFIEITGEAGTGKTIVLHTLLTKLNEEKYRFAMLISNPEMTAVGLMKVINREYGIPSEAENCAELLERLDRFLMEENSAGRNVALIIDEAQDLSPELLEQVRLISSLGKDSDKLIQIVLTGQPELERILGRPELRQLNQRITLRYHLNPLDREDTEGYIEHRLALAGGRNKITFSRGAQRLLFRYSRGTPRLINILCDGALLAAYKGGRRNITACTMVHAFRGVTLKPPLGAIPQIGKRGGFAIAAVFMVIIGYLYLSHEKRPEDIAPKKTLEGKRIQTVVTNPSVNAEKPAGAPVGKKDRELSIKSPSETLNKKAPPPPEVPKSKIAPDMGMKPAPQSPPTDGRKPKDKPAFDEHSALEKRKSALQAFNALAPVMKTSPVGRLGERSPIISQLKRETGKRGLEMDRFGGGLDETIRFGVPTLLDVSSKGSKEALLVALTGSHDGKLSISPPLMGRSSFSKSEMAKLVSGRVYILWRNNERIRIPLAPGDSGNSVIRMQILLQAAGAGSLDVNGIFDEKTRLAVMEFQRSKGLSATGKVGPMTLILLYRSVTEPSSADAPGNSPGGVR